MSYDCWSIIGSTENANVIRPETPESPRPRGDLDVILVKKTRRVQEADEMGFDTLSTTTFLAR